MENTSWDIALIPAIYTFTSPYNHSKRFTCGEHLLRCGIDTSIIHSFHYDQYTTVQIVSPEQPRNTRRASGAPRIAFSGFRKPLHDSTNLPYSMAKRHGFSVTQKGRVSPITRKGLTLETPASPTWASTTVTGTLHTLSSVDLRYAGLFRTRQTSLPDLLLSLWGLPDRPTSLRTIHHRSLARLHTWFLTQSYAAESHNQGLFTPKTCVFFCCGNSAADISKNHTFKWDPLADDVLESAWS